MKSEQISEDESFNRSVTKSKTLVIFVFTIIFGFILFVVPTSYVLPKSGGLTGINLLVMVLFQFFTVGALMYFSLKLLKKIFTRLDFLYPMKWDAGISRWIGQTLP